VKYYFICRIKLNGNNIEPICNEIQSLFKINVDTKKLSEQLNCCAQKYLQELDELKRANLFKFNKHNKASFAKLKFTLRETESNDKLSVKFYAFCRQQLNVWLIEILSELRCLFKDAAPKRVDLIRWIINSSHEPYSVSFNLFKQNKEFEELNCKLMDNEHTVRANNSNLLESELNHSKEVNTSNSGYNQVKQEFDAETSQEDISNRRVQEESQKLIKPNESNELISKLKSDLSEALRDKTAQFEQFKQRETINLDRIKSLESKMETNLKEIQNQREINVELESDSTRLKEIIKSLELRLDEQTQMSETSRQNTICLNRLKEIYERFNCELLVRAEEQQESELSMSYYVDKLFDLLKNYKIKINKLNYDLDEQTSKLIECKNNIKRWQTVNSRLTLKNEELNYACSQLTNKQAKLNRAITSSSSGVFNDVIDEVCYVFFIK